MARAFTIARAVDAAHTAMIVGKINADGTTIYGKPYDKQEASETYCSLIDPATLTWNTGFTDYEGVEIFIGDYVNSNDYCITDEVIFDDEHGAFFIKQNGYSEKNETYEVMSELDCSKRIVITNARTVTTSLYPLDRRVAEQCCVVGHIYEELLGGKTNE